MKPIADDALLKVTRRQWKMARDLWHSAMKRIIETCKMRAPGENFLCLFDQSNCLRDMQGSEMFCGFQLLQNIGR